jgi:hypothetical protein
MAELRHSNLGTPLPPGHQPVLESLQAAYERVAAEQATAG